MFAEEEMAELYFTNIFNSGKFMQGTNCVCFRFEILKHSMLIEFVSGVTTALKRSQQSLYFSGSQQIAFSYNITWQSV